MLRAANQKTMDSLIEITGMNLLPDIIRNQQN
jgi:hypothetical protein